MRQRGVTLIEAVLALAIGAVILVSLSALLTTAGRAQALSQEAAEVTDAGVLAGERLALDLREMVGPPAAAVTLLAPGEVRFQTLTEPAGVHYRVVDQRLMRGTAILAHGVTGFALRYFRADGTEIPAAALDMNQVRRIVYAIDVRRGDVAYRFESGVYPRSINAIAPAWEERP